MNGNRTTGGYGLICQRMRTTLLLVGFVFTGILGAQVLPPPPVRPDQAQTFPTETPLFVRGYRFEGNTAFTDAELAKVTAAFTNRALTSADIEQARRLVTLHYVNHGYVNSGAVIPDQNPENGIITLRIVEGVLSGIEVHGNKWLRDSFIKGRLRRWSTAPLNLNELQEGLQLLRQNPNIRQINAELKPGTAPGQSLLDARVVDQQPFRFGIQIDNQRAPSIGAEEILLLASDLNLTGHSDPLELRYGIANSGTDGLEMSGADNMEGSYLLPFNRFGTTLGLRASRLNTAIVEETFTPLDITSVTRSYGVALRQPVFQTAQQEAGIAIGFDHRQNDTWLLDEPFNISPGAVDGEMVVSALRLSQDWIQRGQDSVLALRSTFSLGINAYDATDNRIEGDPDSQFFSWLGQAQYVRRLFNTQNQLVLRLAGQWTDDALLAIEQFSVGGLETVRGYRENQLVRDRSIVSTVEFRLPVFFDKSGAGIVHLAPFFDFGGGWDIRGSPSPTTLYSTGLGLLVAPNKHVSAQLYWGHRLRDVETPPDKNAQDLGLHFKVTFQAF